MKNAPNSVDALFKGHSHTFLNRSDTGVMVSNPIHDINVT
jgi:predicted phosphodiesterase